MKQISSWASFGGELTVHEHASDVCHCPMTFAVYTPPQASQGPVPVLWYLSGLTCDWSNVMEKSGIQRAAAEHGLMVIAPDTSPRGDNVADNDGYDLGQGAGFYVNATQSPWNRHYHMYDYVLKELPTLIEEKFPVSDRRSVFGHSMGGHGALVLALRNPGDFQSVSAFSPISNPVNCPWGKKAFSAYLGNDTSTWIDYDASTLIRNATQFVPALVDQGDADEFLEEQLKPDILEAAAKTCSYPLELNRRDGYDHSYYFVASFIEAHVQFHASHLSD